MLHLTAGDVNAVRLRAVGLPGTVVACIDVLHEGPAPAEVDGPRWRELRADVAVSRGWATRDWAARRLAEEEDAVTRAPTEHEVVLWFEHDLVCQLQLIRLLARIGPMPPRRWSIVDVGGLAGRPSFRGLGDLAATELHGLFTGRRPVASEVVVAGRDAWSAFTAPEPTDLASLAPPTDALPYLAPALRRHLEEFPAPDVGLGRTERTILELLAERPAAPSALFAAVQAREMPPYMTDLVFAGYVEGLRRPPGLVDVRRGEVSLTDLGGEVLEARRDAIGMRGIDRWLGGVHLEASASTGSGRSHPVWRWDGAVARVERR